MNRILYTLLLALMVVIPANSQNTPVYSVNISLGGSLFSGDLYDSDLGNSEVLCLEFDRTKFFSENLGWSAGISYYNTGAQSDCELYEEITEGIMSCEYHVSERDRLHYVGIPLSLKYRFGGEKKRCEVSIVCRPEWLVYAAANLKYMRESGAIVDDSRDVTKYCNRMDLKYGFKFAYNVSEHFAVGVGATKGLFSISKTKYRHKAGDFRMSDMYVSLAYKF